MVKTVNSISDFDNYIFISMTLLVHVEDLGFFISISMSIQTDSTKRNTTVLTHSHEFNTILSFPSCLLSVIYFIPRPLSCLKVTDLPPPFAPRAS